MLTHSLSARRRLLLGEMGMKDRGGGPWADSSSAHSAYADFLLLLISNRPHTCACMLSES